MARARLTGEAEAEANLAQAAWERRLEQVAPLSVNTGWVATAESRPALPLYKRPASRPEATSIEAALLLAAADQFERGSGPAALESLERLLAKQPEGALLERAHLLGLRLARDAGDRTLLAKSLAGMELRPWTVAGVKESLRLRGLLLAAPMMDLAQRRAAAAEVQRALRSGELGLAYCEDGVESGEYGVHALLDQELTALRRLLEERLPLEPDGAWERAFWEGHRRPRPAFTCPLRLR